MNKSMTATMLAGVLTASLAPCTWAQGSPSSVTLYGTLDIGLARTFTDKTTSVRGSKFPSNWGVRGSEDLGGGLKANFNLESSVLYVDTGAYSGNGGFARQAWVGLSGGFGELMLGRTTTPQARMMGQFDLNGISDVNPWKLLGVPANGSLGGARHSDQVQYATPRVGGLQGRIAYSFDETQKGTATARDPMLQLGLAYSAGAWNAGLVAMPKASAGKLDSVNSDIYQTGVVAGVKYNAGAFVVSTLFQRDEQKALGDSLSLSASMPLGALELGAQYVQVLKSTNAVYRDAKALELFANYSLSKRTRLYAIAAGANDDAKRAGNLLRKHSLSGGVLHRF